MNESAPGRRWLPYYLGTMTVVALGCGAWAAYSASAAASTRAECQEARRQLEKMVPQCARIRAVQERVPSEAVAPVSNGLARPLIPFLEDEARRNQVTIRGVTERPAVQHPAWGVTESQTWIQLEQTSLRGLTFFLHAIETQRPGFFVKELTGLVPEKGKEDSWRVQVVVSRFDADPGKSGAKPRAE